MKRLFLLVGTVVACSLCGTSIAQVELDPWSVPHVAIPQDFDLGNIASDGSEGRQIQIRPMEAEDVGRQWKFFPPHHYFPEFYPDPAPATPAQDDIFLTAGTPLVLVLPQLQHFPQGANVSVAHSLHGQQIVVDASIHLLSYHTKTIYGLHEYLHPLGPLGPGQYHLKLNLTMTSDFDALETATTRGFIDFVVHAVPEPTALTLVLLGGLTSLFTPGRSIGFFTRHSS